VAVVAVAVGLVAAPTASADVSLTVSPGVATVGSTVVFTGAVTPVGATPVEIVLEPAGGGGERTLASGTTKGDGSFRLTAVAHAPGDVFARADGEESSPVSLRIRPRLEARIKGVKVLGSTVLVRGRVRPASAGGAVALRIGRTTVLMAVGGDGRFGRRVEARRAGRLAARFGLRPAAGFVGVHRKRMTRITTPGLGLGARGPAVRFLERRLHDLRYALRGVNRYLSADTRDALYAFQKVKGLSRTGTAGPRVWRALRRARTPRAFNPRGDHIEVFKGRQVLFEVRGGKVVRISHVSTGATGNTPVGKWHVYGKVPGFNGSHMYYSMFFLRGFAIHGYASVPPYQASHGCVRIPLWFAPGLYSRWPVGTTIRVYSS
jgi:hypothetical protein